MRKLLLRFANDVCMLIKWFMTPAQALISYLHNGAPLNWATIINWSIISINSSGSSITDKTSVWFHYKLFSFKEQNDSVLLFLSINFTLDWLKVSQMFFCDAWKQSSALQTNIYWTLEHLRTFPRYLLPEIMKRSPKSGGLTSNPDTEM